MLFPTVDFAVFFVIVFTGSWMLRPYARAWRWFLLLASGVFYLDPFNPIHTEGTNFITFNVAVIAATALAGFITSQVLKACFGGYEGMTAAEWALARRRQSSGVAAAGGDDRDGTVVVDTGTDPGPVPLPPVSVIAPLVIAAMVIVGDVVISSVFPNRPDQNSRWLFLLIGVALVNQAFAQGIFAALGPTRERTTGSRWLVRIAVIFDLAVLGYFKYLDWFADMWTDLLGRVGVNLDWLPGIVLPIAISFFTFQAISYVIDIGRGELRPISLLDFTVYLTFFAHVVAGPIVRVKEFAPQLNARPDPRFVQSAEAFELIFRGLFKKVVISSYLSAQIVKPVFDAPIGMSKVEVLFGILGYAVQIYADFSGYTDMAIGLALLLGIRFPQNFDAPYKSLSLQEFWRRWHMTLSRWLRDYLYIPLGGNRVSPSRTYVNLFLTMFLGGIWHGANWTFLVWGAIHGVGMGAERWIKERWAERGALGLPKLVVGVLQWLVTFTIVCLAWVFFNAHDIANAFEVLKQLFVGEGTVGTSRVTPVLVVVVIGSILSQFVPPEIPARITVAFSKSPPIVQVICGAIGLMLITVLGPEGIAPFIYFQF
jgi:D-alanyl-lipoteichoic acid acyltransferase DltB (MBOAT superfamily)